MPDAPARPPISKTRLAVVQAASLAAALGALGAIFFTVAHRSGGPPPEPDRGLPAKAFRSKGRPASSPPGAPANATLTAPPAAARGGAWKGSHASGPPAWSRPESVTAPSTQRP